MCKILILLFIVSSNPVFSLPSKIEKSILELGIVQNDLVFVMDHSECVNCINAELSYSLKYYENTSKRVFFLNENQWGKEKLELLLEAVGFKVDAQNIVYNKDLYDYLKKKRLIQYNGTKFLKIQALKNPSTLQTKSIPILKLKVIDSIPVAGRNNTIAYDVMKKDNEIYFLSSDLGTVSYLKDGEKQVVHLCTKLDTALLLKMLDLDTSDYIQTLESFNTRKLVGDRFVEFQHFCPSKNGNFVYLSATVASQHTYSLEEKKNMIEKSKLAKITLKNDINSVVQGSIHKPFIMKIDHNWEIIDYYLINESPEDYFVDIHSNLYIEDEKLYGNPVYYPESYSKTFAMNNFLVEVFDFKGHELIHSNFRPEIKSEWYNNKKRKINFVGTNFQKVNGNIFLKTNAFPFWYDVNQQIVFQIPMTELEKLAKKEKNKNYKKDLPAFVNLGILKYNSKEFVGFFRSTVTAKVYYAVFFHSGEFQNIFDLDIDTQYNGIIQVLEDKLVRIKEKHMLIYELN